MNALMVILAACTLTAAQVTDAMQCQPEVTAQGGISGPGQSDAERVARVYWRDAVSRTYGSQYSDWKNAKNTRIECIKFNADTYQCWATGTPCLGDRLIFG